MPMPKRLLTVFAAAGLAAALGFPVPAEGPGAGAAALAAGTSTVTPDQPLALAAGAPFCDPTAPAIADLPDGGFIAAWSDGGVFVQRFDPRGAATGTIVSLRGGPAGPLQWNPAVAAAPDGQIAVVWVEPGEGDLKARVLSGGLPASPAFELAVGIEPAIIAEVVAEPEGSFIAVWQEGEDIGFARFDASGLEQWRSLGSSRGCSLREPSLAAHPEEGVVLAWVEDCDGPPATQSVRARRLSRFGGPLAPLMELTGELPFGTVTAPAVAMDASGRLAAVWKETNLRVTTLFLRWLETEGSPPPSASTEVAREPEGTLGDPDLAVDRTGNAAVVWTRAAGAEGFDPGPVRELFLGTFPPRTSPAGNIRRLDSGLEDVADPKLAVTGPGLVHVLWWAPLWFPPILPPACSGSAGVFAREATLGGDHALLLGGGRFRVEVEWQVSPAGPSGRGRALPGSDDTGQFWFFDPANIELVTKVIDGRESNGHFWFFYGALSNVGYRITVTDQLRNRSRTYENPIGHFASFADTTAFEALDELEALE